jgi:hypothetical protein
MALLPGSGEASPLQEQVKTPRFPVSMQLSYDCRGRSTELQRRSEYLALIKRRARAPATMQWEDANNEVRQHDIFHSTGISEHAGYVQVLRREFPGISLSCKNDVRSC